MFYDSYTWTFFFSLSSTFLIMPNAIHVIKILPCFLNILFFMNYFGQENNHINIRVQKSHQGILRMPFFLIVKMNNNYAVLYVNYTVVFLSELKVNSNFELHMNFCVLYFLHVFQSISIMYNWFRWPAMTKKYNIFPTT